MEAFHNVITQNSRRLSSIEKPFPARLPITNIRRFMVDTEEREWTGPFTFVHMADTQFGLIEKYIAKKMNPRWDAEIMLTKAAIKCINKMSPRPRFIVIGGDMLDAHPEGEEEIQLREEQYDDFVKVFKDLDPTIPLVCVCGNHDIGDEPTEASYQIYRKQFGPDFFSFWVGGVKFAVINTQYLKKPDNLPKKFDKQERFIRRMADSKAKHLVVFQHIPFFVSHPNEEDVTYLNIDKDIRFKFMDKMNDAGVKYIFCGHYHRNGGGTYKNFQQVVTSALGGPFGPDPSGFRLCHVTEHGISHQYIPVILTSDDDDLHITSSLSISIQSTVEEREDSKSTEKIITTEPKSAPSTIIIPKLTSTIIIPRIETKSVSSITMPTISESKSTATITVPTIETKSASIVIIPPETKSVSSTVAPVSESKSTTTKIIPVLNTKVTPTIVIPPIETKCAATITLATGGGYLKTKENRKQKLGKITTTKTIPDPKKYPSTLPPVTLRLQNLVIETHKNHIPSTNNNHNNNTKNISLQPQSGKETTEKDSSFLLSPS